MTNKPYEKTERIVNVTEEKTKVAYIPSVQITVQFFNQLFT